MTAATSLHPMKALQKYTVEGIRVVEFVYDKPALELIEDV
jgi:hypothetical protein